MPPLREPGARCGAAPPCRLTITNTDCSAVRIEDRVARQLQRVLATLVDDVDAREHAGLELPRRVGHFDLGAERAGLRIDGRRDRAIVPVKRRTAERVDDDIAPSAAAQASEIPFSGTCT